MNNNNQFIMGSNLKFYKKTMEELNKISPIFKDMSYLTSINNDALKIAKQINDSLNSSKVLKNLILDDKIIQSTERLYAQTKNLSQIIPNINLDNIVRNSITKNAEELYKKTKFDEVLICKEDSGQYNTKKSQNKRLNEFTDNDVNEIKSDILEIIEDEFKEETIQKSKTKWIDKHPKAFDIIIEVIISLMVGLTLIFIESCTNNATVKQESKVYIEASSNSQVIGNISENSNVTIINNYVTENKYYDYIIYTDVDLNKDIEGYIAKRNIKYEKQ